MARDHTPLLRGAARTAVDSAKWPDWKVATAPSGSVSAESVAPGSATRARSLPLAPRAGLTSPSAASVRYATDGERESVSARLMIPVVCDNPDASVLAVAIDHVHPSAMSPITSEDRMLKRRSPFFDIPFRCHRLSAGSGKLSAQCSTVDHRCSKVELDLLPSGISPHVNSMDQLRELFANLSDLPALIKWAGYFGLTAIVFAETGLLVGFFLPGDSLLVTAGLFSSRGLFNVYLLGLMLNVAAALGNSCGYWIGRASGPRIFTREDSLLFNKKHVYRAQEFYARHGRLAIVLAQFMPIVRTFSPVVAGVGQMPYRQFLLISVIGTVIWVWSMLFTGYFLGTYIPGIDKHIEILILVVVFVSILPGLISWWRERKKAAALLNQIKREASNGV